jgi:hypothetical protein
MWLYYIIISVLLVILLLHGYNKVKHKFWLEQPIFYRYNPINWCRLDTILSDEKPVDTIHLNFLNNNVSYVTDTNVPANVGNIYINEIDMSVKYYEDIVSLMNDYPYFNTKYNNGNMKFLDVNRKMEKSVLKILLENHDYDPIVTLNYKNIYKSDNDTSKVLSIRNIMGVIISIPLYCFFKNKKSGNKNKKQVVASSAHSMPIYFSQVHYNSQEVDETDITMMMKTYNYKMFHDWDEVIRRERDYIHSEKHDTLQKREINRKSKDVNKNSESTESQKNENIYENIYEKNGLKISKKKEKICTSIFIYTGINIPKMVVPFLEYHSFYIPITNWDTVDYRFHASIHLIQIGMQNINILLEYLQLYHTNNATMNKDSKKYARLFEVSILPSLSHIFHLIKSEIYSIYVLLQKNNAGAGTVGANRDTILAVYMFRKSNKIVINKNIIKDANHILHLPISIQMPSTHDNFFICGFINALKMEKKNNKIGCISIDTISHNKKIIDYFLANNKPILVEKNTLLIHNYICKTLLPENVVIMN